MSLLKKISSLLTIIFLTCSCVNEAPKAPTSLQQLSMFEGNLKTQRNYDAYLALEYLVFSRSLLAAKDESSSELFAKKGLAAAKGEYLVPENPISWKADLNQMEGMILMQKRLEMVLDTPHIKFYLPIQMAHLTYLYDCWISRESKAAFRSDELAQCRVRFSKLIDEIEHYIDEQKRDRQALVKITEPEFEKFEIFFDLGSFKLSDRANQDLIKALNYLTKLNGDYAVLVVGNADRVDSDLKNQGLALVRAEIVQNYLIKNGVSKDAVELRSLGENFPDIITQDGMQEHLNRRVAIYVLKGLKSFDKIPLPLVENEIYLKRIKEARTERGLE